MYLQEKMFVYVIVVEYLTKQESSFYQSTDFNNSLDSNVSKSCYYRKQANCVSFSIANIK